MRRHFEALVAAGGVAVFGVGLLLGAVLFGGTTTTASSTHLPPNTVVVPSIVGQPLAVASNALGPTDLTMSPVNAPNFPAGSSRILIDSQSPLAGTHVHKGSTIRITLSAEPVIAVVPNVVGMAPAQAENAIGQAGFNAQVNGVGAFIVRQNPVAGSKVQGGSRVTLTPGSIPASTNRPPS